MRALGVHIFAGGFSLGVERHFELLGHLERSAYGVRVWQHNRPSIPVHVDRAGKWGGPLWDREVSGGVDLVYGNPPCAAWSPTSVGYVRGTASRWMEWARDVPRVARDVGARAAVIESVRGAFRHGREFYRKLRDDHGWGAMQWVFVNAVDHGLAQWRQRLFVVYTLDGAFTPEWSPRPTVRVLDAIAGAPPDAPISPRSIYAVPGVAPEDMLRCVPAIPQGQRVRYVLDDALAAASSRATVEGIRRAKFMGHELGRLHPDLPCPVVYGLARYIHPTEDRLLTLRELMRLQGYPDGFSFEGETQASALRMLGKTVCPPVGEWLAGEVAAHLRGERDIRYVREAVYVCATDRVGGSANVLA